MNSLVSIIIPVYNSEKYLKNCYESIKKQTYQNIEIIFIDDGSNDNSFKLCNELSKMDERVIVKQKNNGGVSSARNLGISSAHGEIILFVDADDTVNSKYVELLVKPLLDNQYDVSICGFLDVFPKKSLERININNISIEGDIEKDFCKIFPLIFSVCNIAYRIDIIKDNKLVFDTEMRQGEDIYFNINYIRHARNIFLVKKYLYNYFHRNVYSLNKKVYYKDFEKFLIRYNSLRNLLKDKNILDENKILMDYAIAGICKFAFLNDYDNNYLKFKNRCKEISKYLDNTDMKELSDWKKKIFIFLLKNACFLLYIILCLKKYIKK